jgi:hypothetical protein
MELWTWRICDRRHSETRSIHISLYVSVRCGDTLCVSNTWLVADFSFSTNVVAIMFIICTYWCELLYRHCAPKYVLVLLDCWSQLPWSWKCSPASAMHHYCLELPATAGCYTVDLRLIQSCPKDAILLATTRVSLNVPLGFGMLYIMGWQNSTHVMLRMYPTVTSPDTNGWSPGVVVGLYSPFLHTCSSPFYVSVLPATGSGSVASSSWDWQHLVPNQLE